MVQRKRCSSGSSRWCSNSSSSRSGHDGIRSPRLVIALMTYMLSLPSTCVAKTAHGGSGGGGGVSTGCAFVSSTAARRVASMAVVTGTTTPTRYPRRQSASFFSTSSSSSSSSSKMKNDEASQQSSNKKKYTIKTNKNNFSRGSKNEALENDDVKVMNNTNNNTTATAAPSTLFSARIESLRERSNSNNSSTDGITLQAECDRLLADCVAADEWDAILDVLDIYQQHVARSGGPENNDQQHLYHSPYRACLQACLEASNAAYALEILQAMKKIANVQQQPDGSDIGLVVVTMCRKQRQERGGWWRQALKLVESTHLHNNQQQHLFDNENEQQQQQHQHQHLSVEVYDAVLACMTEERQWQPAIRLLREMEQLNSSPPTVSSATETAQQQQQQQGVAPALSTYRTVIECCVAARQPEQAVQVLQSCVRRGLTPTVYTFELVIGSLCNTNANNNNDNRNRNAATPNAASAPQWRRAMQIMNLMDRLEVNTTLDIYNNVLQATAKSKSASQAKNLLWQMKKRNVKPNIVSFNSVINACVSSERWKDALSVLDQCHREPGVQPDIYTYTNVMRACAKGGQYRRALSLLQVVKDKKLPLDAYAYTAVIEACAKSRMWPKALELLDEMQQRGIAPTKVTYSVTVNALGNGGQYEKALALLETMRRENLSPNLITYNSAITAISKAAKQAARQNDKNDISSSNGEGEGQELWKRALEILDQMRSDGIQPDGFSFSSAIACCGSQGRWEEALELLEAMERGGPRTRPNRVSYTAAIASCGRAGQVDHALRLFRRMKDQGLSADRVAYNSVFSALRVARRGELALELWEEMLGTKQTIATKIATVRADESMTPDIITVTDAIGAISSMKDYGRQQQDTVDTIFAQAVSRGILLREDFLESKWKVDLHGLSLPVSRAACRYIFQQVLDATRAGKPVQDLTLSTGIGASKGLPAMSRRQSNPNGDGDDVLPSPTSLREYIQEDVLTDFQPSIESSIPSGAQGTVLIKKEVLASWIERQVYR